MRKVVGGLALLAVVGGMLTASSERADARLQYLKAFAEKYETVADQVQKQKCLVCHSRKSKKERSDYAKEVEKILEAKNVKDMAKINASFDSVAKKDTGNGKTYGDLLKDGKLPPPYKEE